MSNESQKPSILFQYRPPKEWAFSNLRKQVFYFGAPRNFNDPYDIRFPLPLMHDLTDEQCGIIRAKEQFPKDMPKDEVVRAFNRSLQEGQAAVRDSWGVTCFSENMRNLLMWSQYAGNGEGFCLGFDAANYLPDRAILQVTYSENILRKNAFEMWAESCNRPYLDFLSRKSPYWKHEKEWRMFRDMEGEARYAPEALKVVYLGSESTRKTQEDVRAIVKEIYPATKLMLGYRAKNKIRVIFRRVL